MDLKNPTETEFLCEAPDCAEERTHRLYCDRHHALWGMNEDAFERDLVADWTHGPAASYLAAVVARGES